MYWVIYNVDTTKIVLRKDGGRSWNTKAAAKAAMTRLKLSYDDHAICEAKYFVDHIEKKEIRHGIVGATGKEYVVGVNTPWTSGPWSETYWCQ